MMHSLDAHALDYNLFKIPYSVSKQKRGETNQRSKDEKINIFFFFANGATRFQSLTLTCFDKHG